MKDKVTKFIKQFLGLFPERLPVGISEFESWVTALSDTYNLPTQDPDSIRFTLATILMHLGPQTVYKPKWFFVITMRAAATKQVAGAIFHDIKQKQLEAFKAAETAAKESDSVSNEEQR